MAISQPISIESEILQTTSGLQSHHRSGAVYLPVQNEVVTVADENVDEYTNQTDQNSEYIEHCDEEYLDDDVENTNSMSMEIAAIECPPYDKEFTNVVVETQAQHNSRIRPNSVIFINDDDLLEECDAHNLKKSTEGLRVLSDVKLPAKIDISNLDRKFGDPFKLEDVFCSSKLQTDGDTIEIYDDTYNVRYVGEEGANVYEIVETVAGKNKIVDADNVVKCEGVVGNVDKAEEQLAYRRTDEVSDFQFVLSH